MHWSSGSWQFISSKKAKKPKKTFIWDLIWPTFLFLSLIMYHTFTQNRDFFKIWQLKTHIEGNDKNGCGQWASSAKINYFSASHLASKVTFWESSDSQCKANINQRRYMQEILVFLENNLTPTKPQYLSNWLSFWHFSQTGWGVHGRLEENSRARGVRLCQLFFLSLSNEDLVSLNLCKHQNLYFQQSLCTWL